MYTCTLRGAPSCHNSVSATHMHARGHTQEDRCQSLNIMPVLSTEPKCRLTPPSFYYQCNVLSPEHTQRARNCSGPAVSVCGTNGVISKGSEAIITASSAAVACFFWGLFEWTAQVYSDHVGPFENGRKNMQRKKSNEVCASKRYISQNKSGVLISPGWCVPG